MKYRYFTTNELKPSGWLLRQLRLQAESLCGNLDKVWRDVRDSAWIGGPAEGWERVPYWLDGFIPLAYLLGDEDMISRAKRYIDAILSKQQSDGWICPCTPDRRPRYDTWAVQLITKVLTVYYECSRDERIPDVIYRVLKNYYYLLKSGEIKLFDWGKFRWFEAFVAIDFIALRYDDEWISDLARILGEQGADYSEYTEHWKRPLNKWTLHTHIVNIAMMLKSEAVSHSFLGEDYTDLAERLLSVLTEHNGTPVGTLTGDECLSGNSPIQGTELCSVVELMYSYELLFAATGDKKWLERLELIAFNALPAAISDDMWSHQYDQMSNQIECVTFPGKSVFRTNHGQAHLFGLEPEYGCCTANFGQGWPKLALSAFAYSDEKLLCAVPVPSRLESDGIRVTLDTDYPFENELRFSFDTQKEFRFAVRIPSFARNITVDGSGVNDTEELEFSVKNGVSELVIGFDTLPEYIDRPNGLSSVKCGSLVFSYPIGYTATKLEYEKDGVERKFPYCDYEYRRTSDWNYAYTGDALKVERRTVSDIPFSSAEPAVIIRTAVRKIDWGYEDGYDAVCAKAPQSLGTIGECEQAALYPYGCAKLRMTEMPVLE